MVNNEKLTRELFAIRERLKNSARHRGDRAPAVCSDDAIYQMVELCPRKKEDFLSISGLGNTFVENYAGYFLDVILKNIETPMEKTVEMDPKARATLKELEKKLIEVNRKNCLLYLAKLPAKRGVDLFDSDCVNPLDILFRGSCVTVCSVSPNENIYQNQNAYAEGSENPAYRQSFSSYRKYTALLREINKDIRDKGQNDLYIGYPFVKGRILGENFDVRCPLVLFPVVADKTPGSISLRLDDSRDVLFNNTLILAFYKFNRIDKALPNDVFDDVDQRDFIDKVVAFYGENGIDIKGDAEPLTRFKEYTAGTFPEYMNGDLHLESCMVLGKFPIRSSMLQKDFDEILEQGSINTLLNELLQNVDDLDYYTDSYSGEEEKGSKDKPLDISEHDLIYINELNSSQESVIAGVEHCDSLVVQGPPGTGKSQVITSLIANYVSKGKTVLMVSEKKTALDVVYSRLGTLSKYALLIDDVGNKDLFYQQLYQMLSIGYSCPDRTEVNLDYISEDIDTNIKKLELIAEKLYSSDSFGIEPYKVYIQAKQFSLADTEESKKLISIRNNTDAGIYTLNYANLEALHRKFSNKVFDDNLASYWEMETKTPWMHWLRGNLSDFDLLTLSGKLSEYKTAYDEWKKKWLIPRLLGKGAVVESASKIAEEFFDWDEKEVIKVLDSNVEQIQQSIGQYGEYQQLAALFNNLNELEKRYFLSLTKCYSIAGNSYTEANEAIWNNVLVAHISDFEANNRELFQDIRDFNQIVNELSRNIAAKKDLTKRKLLLMLMDSVLTMQGMKHYGEIQRILESKRKWSVNKFINKFGFELFKSVKIWLLTPEVVSEILPLEKGLFDLVVFDEASQMYVEKGVPSIIRAKKVVIAGDHKQLRPSNLGAGRTDISEDLPEDIETTAALEEESLLDLARFKYRDIMLNFHYRSRYEELIAFSNYAFYHGRLYVSPNMETPEAPPIEVHKLENGIWTDRANIAEARHIVALLKQFFKDRKNSETIGIITFNVTQRDLIDDLIDEECVVDQEFAATIRNELKRRRDGEDIGLFVKNIESVQGDERDVIIFSIGYARNENGRIVRQWGWLNQKGGENRLNVAISRAKEKVYIVTSIYPEELQIEDAKNDGPKYLKKYLQYAFSISKNDKAAAKEVLMSFGDRADNGTVVSFDSDFEMQVYDALKERGYDVDTQIGIGGYSIDLAVKKNGCYVLGIECDGKLYHSSKSARERDYHRQKYLESRGWRIHRIWSTNWWKNPVNEINKIGTIVDNYAPRVNKPETKRMDDEVKVTGGNTDQGTLRSFREEKPDRKTFHQAVSSEAGKGRTQYKTAGVSQERKATSSESKQTAKEYRSNSFRAFPGGYLLEQNGKFEKVDRSLAGKEYVLQDESGEILNIKIVKPNGRYFGVDNEYDKYFIEEVTDSNAGKTVDETLMVSMNTPMAKALANSTDNFVQYEVDSKFYRYIKLKG